MRDGSGNYNLPAGNPVVTGTVISSTQFNSTMTDVATAMTQSISKDGQTTPTNNLPMGGNKHTGVADGNLANQYASIGQTQNGSLNKATSVANVVDAFTAALTPAIASYTDGQVVYLVPSVTNTTTTVTLALNGLAAKPVQKESGVACAIGDIVLNVPIYLVYYATGGYFLLLNPQKITGARVLAPALLKGTSGTGGVEVLQLDNTAGDARLGLYSAGTEYGVIQVSTNQLNLSAIGASTALKLGVNNGTAVQIAAPGNVTVNPPSSGIGALFNAGGSSAALKGVGTGSGVEVFQLDNSAGDTRFGMYSAATEYALLQAGTNVFNVSAVGASTVLNLNVNGGTSVSISPTNSITFNAPSTGKTLQVNGASAASNSFGINVSAGTNSSDYSLAANSQNGAVNYFKVRGDGVVLGNDGAGNTFELGYKGTPLNTQGTSYTAVAADKGKTINGSATINVTIPNSIFSAGDVLTVSVGSGAVVTIVQGSGVTLQWAGNGATTGSRTLTGAGLASIMFLTASVALISGSGLT